MKYEIFSRSQVMQNHSEDHRIFPKCNGKLLRSFKQGKVIIFFFNETRCGH